MTQPGRHPHRSVRQQLPPPLPPVPALVDLDDETLWRDVIIPRLFTDEDAWSGPFASVELAGRVLTILSAHDTDITAQLGQQNARLESGETTEEAAAEWRGRALGFQRVIRRRKHQMQAPAKRARQHAHSATANADGTAVRRALAQLTEAVAEHECEVNAGTDDDGTDEALWAMLDELTVPLGGRLQTLRQALESGAWGQHRAKNRTPATSGQ